MVPMTMMPPPAMSCFIPVSYTHLVQTAQSAVVCLRDAAHGKHIVFQPLASSGKVYHRKGQQKHSLIAGLQISQKFRW